MKTLKTINNVVITNDLIGKLTKVYHFKGKDFYYREILKNDYQTIVEETIEKDVYFLSQITNLDVTQHRIKLLLKNKAKARSLDEEILMQYFDMFSIIQNSENQFELLSNEITALHKKLYPISKGENVVYSKSTKTDVLLGLVEKQNASKRQLLDSLLLEYEIQFKNNDLDVLLLSSSLYIDLINIKPYTLNNEIVSLLILYILILKNKFDVFKIVSFFELIYLEKDEWENAMLTAGFNWAQGYPQVSIIYRHILDFILMGYNKIEEIVDHYDFDSKLNKSDNIENTILKLPQIFSKEDIRLQHPYVSESTINRTLQRIRDEEKIKPLGTGRSAKWIKVEFNNEHTKFKI